MAVLLFPGQDAALDPDALRRDVIGERKALEPVWNQRGPRREHDANPLPGAVDDGRMSREQRLFDHGVPRRGEGFQVDAAEPALDRGGLDGLAANRAGFGVVARFASMRRRRAVEQTRSCARFFMLLIGALCLPSTLAAAPRCPDMIVGADELEDVLDQTLGGFRGLVDHRSVFIDPDSTACSIRLNLTSSVQLQSGAACTLDACSAVLSRNRSLALREFDVAGCDPVFKMFGLSRHVPSTYVDASARVRQHCASDDFEIDSVSAVRVAGAPKLRIVFRPAAARR